ncbi:MAG: hypothetical protein JSR21_00085 [Proteobacteria bacterium]|nr:hypothetical protein [Pseudomonadota bacterium]
MADQADVEAALVTLVATSLYPSGTGQPSVPGPLCRIYRGWPKSSGLNTDLAAGRVNVTIFPAGGVVRNTTRYMPNWAAQPVEPELQARLSGKTVSFSGAAASGQLAGILIDGTAYVYRTTASDTPASVAANLAAAARQNGIVNLAGASITFPGAGEVLVRVVADGVGAMEVRRQVQDFRVVCWCPTPLLRDRVAQVVDTSLAGITFVPLPDGTSARLTFAGTSVLDQSQNANLYRRDLVYSAEYPTTSSGTQPAMLFGDLTLGGTEYIN